MKSAKFIACCFVEVPNDDVFCNYEFKDSLGRLILLLVSAATGYISLMETGSSLKTSYSE